MRVRVRVWGLGFRVRDWVGVRGRGRGSFRDVVCFRVGLGFGLL